ncbi:PDGLE domain-containing protein [Paenibacillus sp. sptzw28]|nr:PDGLE domain-containing protein [Paenibacillus sp. sptzw28]
MRRQAGEKQLSVTMSRRKWTVILVAAIVAAGLLSPWASSAPDGLNRVAEDHGFSHLGGSINKWALFPGYEWNGLPVSAVKIGGLIGVGLMIAVLWAVSRWLSRKTRDDGAKSENNQE